MASNRWRTGMLLKIPRGMGCPPSPATNTYLVQNVGSVEFAKPCTKLIVENTTIFYCIHLINNCKNNQWSSSCCLFFCSFRMPPSTVFVWSLFATSFRILLLPFIIYFCSLSSSNHLVPIPLGFWILLQDFSRLEIC